MRSRSSSSFLHLGAHPDAVEERDRRHHRDDQGGQHVAQAVAETRHPDGQQHAGDHQRQRQGEARQVAALLVAEVFPDRVHLGPRTSLALAAHHGS